MVAGEELSSDDDDEAWMPREQRAANFQLTPATELLEEVLQWRATVAREAAEQLATDEGGGFFDFDDMPAPEPAPKEIDDREPLVVPQNLDAKGNLEFVQIAAQRAMDGVNSKTAREQIQHALAIELNVIPLGDKRRRELREKAAKDTANAPEEAISRSQAKELGRLLCVLERENPLKYQTPSIGPDGMPQQPLAALPIAEYEAIQLVKKGADLNVRIGDLKRLPLHAAAEKGFPKLIAALLQARADPDKADFAGETALHTIAHSGGWCQAIERDRLLTIVNLVEGGADINFSNPRGRTPLHIAASAGDGTAIKILLDKAADVNAGDLGGFTPLMWAAGRGCRPAVGALLDAEADPKLQAKRGQTAVLFALTNKHNFITSLLEERLAILDKAAEKQAIAGETAGIATPLAEKCDLAKNSVGGDEEDEDVSDKALATSYKWPKQTLHFPYMGKVRQDFVPDMSSNVY